MANKIQIRRDTAANWTSVNPILAQGEEGWETDTGNLKIGDGGTAWTSLAYANLALRSLTTKDPGQSGHPNLIFTGMNSSASYGSDAVIRGEAQPASLILNNNTGTDLSLTHTYEAVQFTTPTSGAATYGAVKIRLKKLAGTPDAATITANIYNDVSGAPSAQQSLNNAATIVYAQSLSTTYAVTEFLVRISSAPANTPYWVVFTFSGVTSGGFVIDSAANGSGNYSYSTNGTAWTAGASKPYLELRGQNPAGVQGTSETYCGVRGDSNSYYGVYGYTQSGIGTHGGSVNGVGVEGLSQTGVAGVYGIGSNGYGVYGTGTNFAGVYGTSPNSIGVQGVSANANVAAVEGDSTNTGPGMYGTNNSTGPGVKAESLSGNGPALHAVGHFKSTFGWPASGAAQSGAGTTPPAPVLTWPGANDVRGTVTTGTGTAPAAGAQVTITFGKVYDVAPTVMACPANAATWAVQPYVSAVSTTSFTISFGVAPAASQANTTYAVSYWVIS